MLCIDMAKARRNELTLKEKINIIDASHTQSQRQLPDQFNVGKSQVQRILKRKAEFMEAFEENQPSDKKRLCTGANSSYEKIDAATWHWFNHSRSLNQPVSGPFIQQKALDYAKHQNVPDFKASNGRLERFKARPSFSCAVISGERASVDVQTNGRKSCPQLLMDMLLKTSTTWMRQACFIVHCQTSPYASREKNAQVARRQKRG